MAAIRDIDTPKEAIEFVTTFNCPVCHMPLVCDEKTFQIGIGENSDFNTNVDCSNLEEHYTAMIEWKYIENIFISYEKIKFFIDCTRYDVSFLRFSLNNLLNDDTTTVKIYSLQEDESCSEKPDVTFDTKCRYFDLSKFSPERFARKIEKIRLLK